MTLMTALWLPVLLSAVAVFVTSAIIHMLPLWHAKEYQAPPDADRIASALQPFGIPPGDYMLPRAANMDEMKTPEFAEKLAKGPVMIMTVLPNGPISMGKSLGLWFVYSVVVSVFAAYIAGRALGPGSEYLAVFRFAGATAFIGYSLALWQMSIWYNRGWGLTIKATFDGLIYALVTAGVFASMWP